MITRGEAGWGMGEIGDKDGGGHLWWVMDDVWKHFIVETLYCIYETNNNTVC